MLPQSPGVSPANCVAELERCVKQLGFIGCNLNPDPSGGWWKEPPLTDRWWYPIYEKMVELDVPAMVHVSSSCNPAFHFTGAHYINADTTAIMQLIQGDLFKDFPQLKLVIPHGGGAVPYHWGRYRGLAQDMKRPLLRDHLLRNVYFDTCVYHQPGIDLLLKVIPVDNILFASEMVGAVRGIDPETGQYFDDTKRYIDAKRPQPRGQAEDLRGQRADGLFAVEGLSQSTGAGRSDQGPSALRPRRLVSRPARRAGPPAKLRTNRENAVAGARAIPRALVSGGGEESAGPPGLVQRFREDDRRDEHRRAEAVGDAERERDARDGDDEGADAQDQPDAAVSAVGADGLPLMSIQGGSQRLLGG